MGFDNANHDAIKHHFHDIDWDVRFDNSYDITASVQWCNG